MCSGTLLHGSHPFHLKEKTFTSKLHFLVIARHLKLTWIGVISSSVIIRVEIVARHSCGSDFSKRISMFQHKK
jgi:hypothetical protein